MKYRDLPDSGNPKMTCTNDECDQFHQLYSANRGDYFMHPPEATVYCGGCDREMRLAHEVRTIVIEGETL